MKYLHFSFPRRIRSGTTICSRLAATMMRSTSAAFNPQKKNMKTTPLISRCLIILGIFALSQFGTAPAATITFNPSTSTVLPGGSFTVDVFGSSVNQIGGFSLFLNSSDSGTDIQISNWALNTTLFTYGGPGPTFPEIISSTQNSQDLGAFANSPLAASTPFLLGTASISIGMGITPGSYTIGNTSATVFTDPTFTNSDFASVATFAIDVIPEPGTTWLLLGSLGGLLAAQGVRKFGAKMRGHKSA